MAIEPLKLRLVFGILDHSSDTSESVLCMKQGYSGVSALSVYRSVNEQGLRSHVATAQKCACLRMEMTGNELQNPSKVYGNWLGIEGRANISHRCWSATEAVVLKSVTSRGCTSILSTLFCFLVIPRNHFICWWNSAFAEKIKWILENYYKIWIREKFNLTKALDW